MSCIYCD